MFIYLYNLIKESYLSYVAASITVLYIRLLWRVGRGREPWERSEAGGVNDNERHLRHSPVSSPTEELRKE